MNEELVQNSVTDEKIVKNIVVGAKIDLKILSIFKKLVDGTVCSPATKKCWKNLLMRTNLGCW